MLAVVIIDCAEHALLNRLMAAGRMPALAALTERGVSVPLRSDGDSLDGSVFQSMVTGVNAGRHGVCKYQQIAPGTYSYRMSRAADSPQPQIWQRLSDRGRRCCVFDVPKAHVIEDFTGDLIAAWGAYTPAAEPGSWPAPLYDELIGRFGEHPKQWHDPLPLTAAGYERAEAAFIEGVRRRAEACRWLLGRGPFDFFMMTFSETHAGAHQFWQFHDPNHPMYDASAAEQFTDATARIYEAVDEALASVLEALGDDATVCVLTQQGMQQNYSGSHLLPRWLAQREGKSRRSPLLERIGPLLGSPLRNYLHHHLPRWLTDRLVAGKFKPASDVFMMPGSEYSALLRVNLIGREPAGTVRPEDYTRVLQSLRDDAMRLINPATGEPAVERVIFTHERYRGPCIDRLPDAVLMWRNDAPIESLSCPRCGELHDGIAFTDMTHSMHTAEGWAVFSGPDLDAGEIDQVHDVLDLVPTWLSLMNEPLPTPDDLDGRAIDLQAPSASRALRT